MAQKSVDMSGCRPHTSPTAQAHATASAVLQALLPCDSVTPSTDVRVSSRTQALHDRAEERHASLAAASEAASALLRDAESSAAQRATAGHGAMARALQAAPPVAAASPVAAHTPTPMPLYSSPRGQAGDVIEVHQAAQPTTLRYAEPPGAARAAAPARHVASASAADEWSDEDGYDAFGGEERPDMTQLLAATRARVTAAADASAATDDFKARSAARRAEYSAAGHAAAGPTYGRRFVKEEAR